MYFYLTQDNVYEKLVSIHLNLYKYNIISTIDRPCYLKPVWLMKEVKHIIIREPLNAAGETKNRSTVHNRCMFLNHIKDISTPLYLMTI